MRIEWQTIRLTERDKTNTGLDRFLQKKIFFLQESEKADKKKKLIALKFFSVTFATVPRRGTVNATMKAALPLRLAQLLQSLLVLVKLLELVVPPGNIRTLGGSPTRVPSTAAASTPIICWRGVVTGTCGSCWGSVLTAPTTRKILTRKHHICWSADQFMHYFILFVEFLHKKNRKREIEKKVEQ